MSREIQRANVGGLPIPAEDQHWAHSTALGPAMPQHAPLPPQPAPLKKIHRLLRGRYIIATILGLVLGVTGAYFGWKSTRPLYASHGFVEIQPVMQNPFGPDRPVAFYTSYVQSQAKLMTTQRVVEPAMNSPEWARAGWGNYHDDEAQKKFRERLSVGMIKNHFYIQIEFRDEDPVVAQTAVNAILGPYQRISQEEGIGAAKMKLELLEKEMNANNAAIATMTQQVRELSREYQTDDLKPYYDAQLTEMVRFENAYLEASVTLMLAEAQIEAVRANGGADAASMTVEQIAQFDPEMAKLIARRSENQFDMDEARISGGENHPRVRQLRERAKLIDNTIESRAKIVRTQLQASPNGLGGDAMTIEQLRVKEKSLREIYEAAKAKTLAIGERHLKIKELKEDIRKREEQNEEYAERVRNLNVEAQIGGMKIYPAERPVSYAVDKRKQFAAVGFVGGFGLPWMLFLLIGLLDSRYRYSEEAGTDMSGVTLLGILPNLPDLLTDPEQAAIAAHCVHQIRTMLQINGGGEDRRVFAVTSASPGDGKTSLTLALGLSFAASGSRTLIIDCDLVGAGLTTRMNMASADGVLEAIANRTLLDYIRTTDIADLAILPVGSAQAHHASLLSPAALRRLVAEARKHFETILIDTGPILGSIEASSVAAAADGVILCVARGQQRPLVEKSLQHMASIGARLAGVVFNRAQARDFERSVSRMSMRSVPRNGNGNGHGHGHGEGKGAIAPANRFGPVARAVASSVKPGNGEEDGHE